VSGPAVVSDPVKMANISLSFLDTLSSTKNVLSSTMVAELETTTEPEPLVLSVFQSSTALVIPNKTEPIMMMTTRAKPVTFTEADHLSTTEAEPITKVLSSTMVAELKTTTEPEPLETSVSQFSTTTTLVIPNETEPIMMTTRAEPVTTTEADHPSSTEAEPITTIITIEAELITLNL